MVLLVQEYVSISNTYLVQKPIIANAFSRLLTVEDLHVVYLMEEYTMTND